MQQQKQIMSSGFHEFAQRNNSIDSNGHFQTNGNIPSSNHQQIHVYSKSAAGGTYV